MNNAYEFTVVVNGQEEKVTVWAATVGEAWLKLQEEAKVVLED